MERKIERKKSYPESMQTYRWWDFRKQQTKLLLDTFDGLRYNFTDGYELNILRPDSHLPPNDCLHNCLHNCFPGPMDALNQFLLH
jgi:hypothetical protein